MEESGKFYHAKSARLILTLCIDVPDATNLMVDQKFWPDVSGWGSRMVSVAPWSWLVLLLYPCPVHIANYGGNLFFLAVTFFLTLTLFPESMILAIEGLSTVEVDGCPENTCHGYTNGSVQLNDKQRGVASGTSLYKLGATLRPSTMWWKSDLMVLMNRFNTYVVLVEVERLRSGCIFFVLIDGAIDPGAKLGSRLQWVACDRQSQQCLQAVSRQAWTMVPSRRRELLHTKQQLLGNMTLLIDESCCATGAPQSIMHTISS